MFLNVAMNEYLNTESYLIIEQHEAFLPILARYTFDAYRAIADLSFHNGLVLRQLTN
jgi:hypothetical protein